MAKSVTHLLKQFIPKHYKLDLTLNREKETFSGNVVIFGKKTGRPSKRITLHQTGLKITKAEITHHDKKTGDKNIDAGRILHHSSYDEVRLHSEHLMYPGQYTLTIHFHGKITKPMHGVYPSFFTEDGKDKQLIATQFESHHAREVFPCIDEPAAKATFDLILRTIPGETSLSNMPIKKQAEENNLLVTHFETTPHMSTYLLAFITGELGYKEAKTKDEVVVRAYATKDKIDFTDFALDCAVKMLEFYNEYFAIDYPLPKCDFVALPDFAAGAMENWGLITFREHALLVDPANTSISSKQYVAMVVAHELAHQWFGNLVTMKWWTDLWLNEGFASWIEFLAVDNLFPEWQMWTQFVVEEGAPALKLDALEYTHPIVVPVNNPSEIRTIFDTISYSKGSSVIQMLHEYLGKEFFRDGLRYYLDKHKYANTDTVDLWDALETISGKPVKAFMNAWTTQPGYPIVQSNINEDSVELKQERFYSNPEHGKGDDLLWPIPLQSNHTLLPERLDEATLTVGAKDTDNLKFNRGAGGFYRVAYNASHLHRLGELIQRGKMDPIDRLNLLNDTFEAAKAGYIETTDALSLLENFSEEDNATVWDVIVANVGGIRMVMNDDKLRETMKPYGRKLVAKQLKRLGWDVKENDSHFDRLLRPTILSMASASDDEAVVKHALELFKKMHHSEDLTPDMRQTATRSQFRSGSIDPDLRGVVYGTVARRGGNAEFKKLITLHDETQMSEERLNLTAAITGFTQPELISKALDHIKSDHVRMQDVIYWLSYSFMNRHAKELTWDWMVKHWDWLENNLGNDSAFYRFPIYSARAFNDHKFIPVFKKFFDKVNKPGMERSINQGVEMIQWQASWKSRDLKLIKAYFEQKA